MSNEQKGLMRKSSGVVDPLDNELRLRTMRGRPTKEENQLRSSEFHIVVDAGIKLMHSNTRRNQAHRSLAANATTHENKIGVAYKRRYSGWEAFRYLCRVRYRGDDYSRA